MLDDLTPWLGMVAFPMWLGLAAAALLIAAGFVWNVRARRKARRARAAREEGIKAAAATLDQREQFEWTYRSGRYKNPKSIPRTMNPAPMTKKERARRENGIGEFSSGDRYLEPPESSWD